MCEMLWDMLERAALVKAAPTIFSLEHGHPNSGWAGVGLYTEMHGTVGRWRKSKGKRWESVCSGNKFDEEYESDVFRSLAKLAKGRDVEVPSASDVWERLQQSKQDSKQDEKKKKMKRKKRVHPMEQPKRRVAKQLAKGKVSRARVVQSTWSCGAQDAGRVHNDAHDDEPVRKKRRLDNGAARRSRD